jgi:DNA invertase Pin-like site-specific DNA recombinase
MWTMMRPMTTSALTDPGVTLISATDGIDSSTAARRMVIGALASMAEFERELVRERTALKRAASRANGTKFGRPKNVADFGHIATATRMKADGHTARDIAKFLGVSRATLYRYLAGENAAWRQWLRHTVASTTSFRRTTRCGAVNILRATASATMGRLTGHAIASSV